MLHLNSHRKCEISKGAAMNNNADKLIDQNTKFKN